MRLMTHTRLHATARHAGTVLYHAIIINHEQVSASMHGPVPAAAKAPHLRILKDTDWQAPRTFIKYMGALHGLQQLAPEHVLGRVCWQVQRVEARGCAWQPLVPLLLSNADAELLPAAIETHQCSKSTCWTAVTSRTAVTDT